MHIRDLGNSEEAHALTFAIEHLWQIEEQHGLQRSRIQWLTAGDKNTKKFHLSTIQRRQKNRILKIKTGNHLWLENEVLIRREFEFHFEKLFTSTGPRNWTEVMGCVPMVISPNMNSGLMMPITEEECKAVAYDLGAKKSPGPDGFSGLFYQHYWSLVCQIIHAASGEFYCNETVLQQLNMTEILLIPKIPHLELVGQF